MPVSDAFTQIAALMPADFNIPTDDYAATRRKMKPWHGHPLVPGTTVENIPGGDRPMVCVTHPECTNQDRYALFCHGGGFVSCPMEDYLFYAEHISRVLDCRVMTVDYRLAPEHRYPAAVEDCTAAYRSLLARGIAPAKMFTIGDSCGAGLAVCLLLMAGDEDLPMPACHIGQTGWYDLALDEDIEDHDPRAEPMITPGWYRNRVQDYLGNQRSDARYASAATADCTGLPPLLLQMGSHDLCLPGARRFRDRASAAGVAVELQVSEGMVHGFHGLIGSGVPEALAAWQAAKAFLDRHI